MSTFVTSDPSKPWTSSAAQISTIEFSPSVVAGAVVALLALIAGTAWIVRATVRRGLEKKIQPLIAAEFARQFAQFRKDLRDESRYREADVTQPLALVHPESIGQIRAALAADVTKLVRGTADEAVRRGMLARVDTPRPPHPRPFPHPRSGRSMGNVLPMHREE